MEWMMWSDFDLFHWIFFAAAVAVFVYPIGRILTRLGYSPYWCIVALVPFFNLVALWVLALSEWQRDTKKADKALAGGRRNG